MNVNYKTGKKETIYFVKSHCSYPNSAQAHLLANTIQHDFQIATNLKEHLKLYEDFIKKYKGTFASMNKDSNYAENEAIYRVLSKIYSQTTTQGKCLP